MIYFANRHKALMPLFNAEVLSKDLVSLVYIVNDSYVQPHQYKTQYM